MTRNLDFPSVLTVSIQLLYRFSENNFGRLLKVKSFFVASMVQTQKNFTNAKGQWSFWEVLPNMTTTRRFLGMHGMRGVTCRDGQWNLGAQPTRPPGHR